jgi:hypothetical protein
MRRRDFLKVLGGGAGLAAGLGVVPGLGLRGARAGSAWGEYPAALASARLPSGKIAKNVLEVHLWGGMSAWESFYVVDREDWGKAEKLMWWTFQEEGLGIEGWYDKCSGPTRPPLLKPFAVDALGTQVKFGPYAHPFRERTDILDRLRMVVLSHDLFPHEAAAPFALTGVSVGQPRMAGVGAAVQHHFFGKSLVSSPRPAAYVITEEIGGFAASNGAHPGYARPILLRSDGVPDLANRLRAVADNDAKQGTGALMEFYANEYQQRLRSATSARAARAPAVDDFQFSLGMRKQAGYFADVLSAEGLSFPPAQFCGQIAPVDRTRSRLALAARLLNQPDNATRHVTVIDFAHGTSYSDPFGYDAHFNYMVEHSTKLPYFWTRLIEIINEPGEKDPGKIDLDETLVVISSEFGRSPQRDDLLNDSPGRNHWPYGYVSLMFGGPVGPEQRGIVGAIDSSGYALDGMSPASTRAAQLAALGIYPFAAEAYSTSDIRGASDELEAALMVREQVLGVKS